MLSNYIPILVVAGVATLLALISLGLSRVLVSYRLDKGKLQHYECGMYPVGDASARYSISFYLIAMAFIVFDLEVVFVYPWAVRLLDFEVDTLISMVAF